MELIDKIPMIDTNCKSNSNEKSAFFVDIHSVYFGQINP